MSKIDKSSNDNISGPPGGAASPTTAILNATNVEIPDIPGVKIPDTQECSTLIAAGIEASYCSEDDKPPLPRARRGSLTEFFKRSDEQYGPKLPREYSEKDTNIGVPEKVERFLHRESITSEHFAKNSEESALESENDALKEEKIVMTLELARQEEFDVMMRITAKTTELISATTTELISARHKASRKRSDALFYRACAIKERANAVADRSDLELFRFGLKTEDVSDRHVLLENLLRRLRFRSDDFSERNETLVEYRDERPVAQGRTDEELDNDINLADEAGQDYENLKDRMKTIEDIMRTDSNYSFGLVTRFMK